MLRCSALLAIALLAGACSASVAGGEGKRARNACDADARPAVAVRRLSSVEYNRTIRDLFPLGLTARELSADLPVHGFENASSSLNPSAVLLEQYGDAAAGISWIVGEQIGSLYPCAGGARNLACGYSIIDEMGSRAFRRPLTEQERDRYRAFFALNMAGNGFRLAIMLTTQAFLQAPQFLYRIESSQGPLTDYELASRLSYFLWQSMPDAELFAAAAAGELHTRPQIEAQARRMVKDPRSTEAVVDFHRQWLSFDRIMDENKDAVLYPGWNDTLRDAMREESDRFVAHLYESGASMPRELLTSRKTFVNEPLAKFYGVPSYGNAWYDATLPEGERSGILTRGNFLAGYAHSTNGSPPLRGVAVLEKLLCAAPPPPPNNADTSTPKNEGPTPRTNRDLFVERTSPKSCQGCHVEIDGIGLSFERYDAMGAFRTTDNGLPVDASGRLVKTEAIDGPFDGAIELSSRLADSDQVRDCMVLNWFRFAFARDPARADRCALDAYAAALDQHQGDIRALLVAIASSDLFIGNPGPTAESPGKSER